MALGRQVGRRNHGLGMTSKQRFTSKLTRAGDVTKKVHKREEL